jgi:ABC-2 type transport system permease protein
MTTVQATQAVVARELLTVFRSRSYWVLLAGVLAVVFGMVSLGGGPEAGYLPTALDLLLPLELLVPAVAVALGYPPIVGDAGRGELEVLETYPLPAWGYVVGTYVGRAIGLVALVGVPLSLLAVYVSLTVDPAVTTVATHQGVDSILLFGRFGVLTVGFALTVLAIVLAASALAWSRQVAVVFAIAVFGIVVVALDVLLLRGFAANVIGADVLTTALALSPTSAYRGLVFETVLSPAQTPEVRNSNVLASGLGLLAWAVVSLWIATVAVERQ